MCIAQSHNDGPPLILSVGQTVESSNRILTDMPLEDYFNQYQTKITQASERLFVEEFLYPLLGENIFNVTPQHSILDRTGKARRIDFAYHGQGSKIALEVNGETYHAEGIIPNEMFDDNLFRQNEILRLGYKLVRFSYSQLQSPYWREIVATTLRDTFADHAPELLSTYSLEPNQIQLEALESLSFYRDSRRWERGIVIMPTGTGKTILSALDAQRVGPPILFLVHRLDILKQSIDAYRKAWPSASIGILTGEQKENELKCDILFASKDTLRQPEQLQRFSHDHFRYVIVDEVHHGQSHSYKEIFRYFKPRFMLGMTATPDRADRKDIFELFNYCKIFESTLQEAIDRNFLVPYTYYGLTDNVDYSSIRFQGLKYRVDDLERKLIIPERNQAILDEYILKGEGDKAIGFCVSIQHSDRMAEYFTERGISAVSIHSQSPNRDELLKRFRVDKIQVAFTVDLFNEGVDFPNVRVLLFLRPTESKTVFLQQLGRGLRLCTGKDRVRILDFIGNYKRANQIRKYLSVSSAVVEEKAGDRTQKKITYTYSKGCKVEFTEEVEEILNRQDALDLGFDKNDLKEAYFVVSEKLGRKPTKSDLDTHGEFKISQYLSLYGTWLAFLRAAGEYTEASYHYPQGTHLGHILSILKYFGLATRESTPFRDEYIRFRGGYGEGRIGSYRRQIKYKLQAAMELGLILDDRSFPDSTDLNFNLAPAGIELRESLLPILDSLTLDFPLGEDGVPSTQMSQSEQEYNASIRTVVYSSPSAKQLIYKSLLGMNAVTQMLLFLYSISRRTIVDRSEIYEQFFQAPFVKRFCEQEGIEEATIEASKRRCPFLLNILDACGIIEARRSEIEIKRLLLTPALVKSVTSESDLVAVRRLEQVQAAWPSQADMVEPDDLSILRELFGPEFLTPEFHLTNLEAFYF